MKIISDVPSVPWWHGLGSSTPTNTWMWWNYMMTYL